MSITPSVKYLMRILQIKVFIKHTFCFMIMQIFIKNNVTVQRCIITLLKKFVL